MFHNVQPPDLFIRSYSSGSGQVIGQTFNLVSKCDSGTWQCDSDAVYLLARKPGVSGAASSLAGDVTWSRDVTAYCYSVVLLIMSLCRAQSIFNTAQHWLMYVLVTHLNLPAPRGLWQRWMHGGGRARERSPP